MKTNTKILIFKILFMLSIVVVAISFYKHPIPESSWYTGFAGITSAVTFFWKIQQENKKKKA